MKTRVNPHRQKVLLECFDPGTPAGDSVRDLAESRDLIARLGNALRHLHDYQNGCPLPSYETEWNRAMEKCRALLPEVEGLTDELGVTIDD